MVELPDLITSHKNDKKEKLKDILSDNSDLPMMIMGTCIGMASGMLVRSILKEHRAGAPPDIQPG